MRVLMSALPSISSWNAASTTLAPHAFAQLGYLAAWRFDDFEAAFRFGQLGYELIERRGLRRFEGIVCLNVSTL